MIVKQGAKFHIVMRRNYETQLQRHFAGVVGGVDRTTVRSTGYIVNIIPSAVLIDNPRYETIGRTYLAATGGSRFKLEINEYGLKR